MEFVRLRECFERDAVRLRAVAGEVDLTTPVPTCPEWTVSDLVQHVSAAYLHKLDCIRTNTSPDPWPPPGLAQECERDPWGVFDRAYAALRHEFATHEAGSPAFTWYVPDQSVGFWLRRMAQETVIHRIDAELSAGVDPAPVPADLAIDGIDEMLTIFLAYGSKVWPEPFVAALDAAEGLGVRVATTGVSWTVHPRADVVEVTAGGSGEVAATVSGEPAAMLRWLWQRADDSAVMFAGDPVAVDRLRRVLYAGGQ